MMRETIRLSAAVDEAVRVLRMRLDCGPEEAREALTVMACVKGERLADVASNLLADELRDGPDGGGNVSDALRAPSSRDGSGTQVRRSTRPTA
jgi:hypothetical protein